jgi:hypothetical protein
MAENVLNTTSTSCPAATFAGIHHRQSEMRAEVSLDRGYYDLISVRHPFDVPYALHSSGTLLQAHFIKFVAVNKPSASARALSAATLTVQ